MGLGDWLSDAFSGLGSLATKVGSTIAREATDFTGALVGGAYGALSGKPVELPALTGLSTAAEALGGALGTSIGGGVGTAIVRKAQQAGKAGTSGVEANTSGGTIDIGSYYAGGALPVKATALPGGAPIQAGVGGALISALEAVGESIVNYPGIIPEIGQYLLPSGGETVANGGALTLPGATPGTIYRVTNQRLVPRRTFVIPNPSTGQYDFFGPKGRPVLFESDFAACRRVERVARKCRRYVRKR